LSEGSRGASVNGKNWQEFDLSQRTLRGLLTLYQRSGYNIFFSDGLVSQSMVVQTNPEGRDPIERLQKVLLEFGLLLDHNPSSDAWYVVSDPDGFKTTTLYVKAKNTGRPVAEAVFRSEKWLRSYKSDSQGKVILPLTEHSQTISIEHAQYEDVIIVGDEIYEGQVLSLPSEVAGIEEVVVTASTYRMRSVSTTSQFDFDGVDIGYQPTRGGDAIQVINNLPGMATSGVSAKPNIRGGEKDELLILFDGVELLDPFHLKDFQGMVSGINPSVVASMDVYTGGYTARYGSRMSGVLDIHLLEESDLPYELEYNLLATSGKASGSISSLDSQWLIAGRRGNIDETVDRFNSDIGTPRFSDFFAKWRWQPTAATIDFGALTIVDDISLNLTRSNESAQSEYGSHYGWVNVTREHGPQSESQWLLTYINIENNRHGNRIADDPTIDSEGTLSDERRFNIVRLEYRNTSEVDRNQVLQLGIKVEYAKGLYHYSANATHGDFAILLGQPEVLAQNNSASYEGVVSDAFISYRFSPTEELQIESGLRFDGQTFGTGSRHQFSPRLSTKYQLSETLSLRASAGRFYQASQITELDVEVGADGFYPAQKADHLVLGLQYESSLESQWFLEVYQKRIFTPRARSENLFERYLLLPELAPDRVHLQPLRASSHGIELRYDYRPKQTLHSWLSYTISRAEDEFYDGDALRTWDQTHGIVVGLNYIPDKWILGIQMQWHTGWPITQLPATYPTNEELLVFDRNNDRLPDYFVINAKISYQWKKPQSLIKAYLDVGNITNRENTGGYSYLMQGSQGDSYSFFAQPQSLFPIIPILGVQWQF
jgi:outer membrane receptor protein involved in Fe transport